MTAGHDNAAFISPIRMVEAGGIADFDLYQLCSIRSASW
jgi:hypothetical protein